jgi:lauroyl/myristoyl acyltransferase
MKGIAPEPPRRLGRSRPHADEASPAVDPRHAPPVESVRAEPALGAWKRLAFAVTHGATSALLALVSLQGLYRFGRAFGAIEWLINYKRRRRFGRALAEVFGHELHGCDRRRWTREHFQHTRCDKLFYLIFDRTARERIPGLLTIANEELLEAAVRRGRGVYMAMAHHGALHVVALLMVLRGYKVVGVRDRQEGAMRRYVQHRLDVRFPELGRMRVLFADSFPREIYRAFDEGCLVGSAMDVSRVRFPHQKVEEVAIFGEKRAFLSGPLRIAIRRGAPALQAFVVPEAGFRYRLELSELVPDPGAVADEEPIVAAAMETYARNVEKFIRASPALMTRA